MQTDAGLDLEDHQSQVGNLSIGKAPKQPQYPSLCEMLHLNHAESWSRRQTGKPELNGIHFQSSPNDEISLLCTTRQLTIIIYRHVVTWKWTKLAQNAVALTFVWESDIERCTPTWPWATP